ncbi:MAG: tetratricopeptide repeat protein [Prochlorococcus sp.]
MQGINLIKPKKGFNKKNAQQESQDSAKERRALELINQGKLIEAEEIYEKLVKKGACSHIAYGNLAAIYGLKGRKLEMIELLRKALEIQPDYPDAHINLGTALKENGDLNGAIASFQQALKLKPSYLEAHINLGNALHEQGDLIAGIVCFENALKLKPSYPEAHWNLSLVQLLSGNYAAGWANYDWRHKKKNAQPSTQQWQGEDLRAEEQLLVISEQGLGDTIQFMRYIPYLQQKGIDVSFCPQKELHLLIKAAGIHSNPITPEQAHIISNGKWIPLLSLPRYLGVNQQNPIISEPYVTIKSELINRWKEILSKERMPIIGINWQGSPNAEKTNQKGRSIPLEAFLPITKNNNLSFLSLQKGYGSEQLYNCSFRNKFVHCQNQVNDVSDFLETAAIIANCDLIITSDTSIAHLAGSMGKKTWVLLKKIPEWRWGMKSEKTFWYPSMRLFRQIERSNWHEVIERVSLKVNELIASQS